MGAGFYSSDGGKDYDHHGWHLDRWITVSAGWRIEHCCLSWLWWQVLSTVVFFAVVGSIVYILFQSSTKRETTISSSNDDDDDDPIAKANRIMDKYR